MNYAQHGGGAMNGHPGNGSVGSLGAVGGSMGSIGGVGSVGLPPATRQQYQHPVYNNRKYTLEVVQQPVRARMCGFGDKDRRPITPPPCVRLIVQDATTGEELKVEDIDSSFFVLCVDLAPADDRGQQDVTVVKHSSNSPAVSISAASTTSYPPAPERPYFGLMGSLELANYYRNVGDHHQAQQIYNHHFGVQYPQVGYGPPIPMPVMPSPAASMYTRNIIGSLAVNAFKLQDTTGKLGLWFILQDLSIRTEGSFRLKMQFVDVSGPDGRTLTHDKVPILATCWSDTFQVYSAKKFPGVIESTALSKTFAQQGIKIPIRKDGPKSVPNQAEFDNDDI